VQNIPVVEKRRGPRFVPPPPPRTPKAAATRRHLIAVAGDLVIERGYAAVSLADIAARAGLTKGAIYGHFRSKGQMLVEVIRWKLAEREGDPAFGPAVERFPEATGLIVDPGARAIRLLEVDAAAAARHDADVASGMAELYAERDAAIRAAVAGAAHPDVVAFVLGALSNGVGTKEAVGLPVPGGVPWVETVGAMLASVVPPPAG
jgi:AcrR family transcriptional regulator